MTDYATTRRSKCYEVCDGLTRAFFKLGLHADNYFLFNDKYLGEEIMAQDEQHPLDKAWVMYMFNKEEKKMGHG